MPGSVLRSVCLAAVMAVLSAALAPAAEQDDPWPGLVQDIFNDRAMADGSAVLALDMPARAEDAAAVPVTLRIKPAFEPSRRVVAITLVIDRNPAPMAAKFTLGADAHVSEISTRVRVNNYTDVHAVAETSDGRLHVVKTYVKASGGCSAPAAKHTEEAKARLGQIRYQPFTNTNAATSGLRDAQVTIGHPNNSGLQMDQVTQLYTPAFYIDRLRFWQDDSPILSMDGGISISEDPSVRVSYVTNGARTVRVEARDTDGHVFAKEWKADGAAM